MAVASRNPQGAPADQSEFYRHYFGYVVRFVEKYGGIRPQDAEDVANSIWVRLLDRDVLHQFDPDYVIVHNGMRYPARFESYLAKMLDLYVRHYRVKQKLRDQREMPVDTIGDAGELFDYLLGGSDAAVVYEAMEEHLLVVTLTDYLRRVPARAVGDTLDLERLFGCVVEQARTEGQVNIAQLSEILQVPPVTVRSWLKVLRGHLRDALDGKVLPPLPVPSPFSTQVRFGGVLCTLAHLHEAHATLTADSSNMIKQPLARAQSPLAGCDYHGLNAAFRATHPEFVPTKVGLGPGRSMGAKETFLAALADTLARYADGS